MYNAEQAKFVKEFVGFYRRYHEGKISKERLVVFLEDNAIDNNLNGNFLATWILKQFDCGNNGIVMILFMSWADLID